MNINEVKNLVKITKDQEKVILNKLGDDLEIIDQMYKDLVKSSVSEMSGGGAPGIIILDNPLLGRFLILSGNEDTENTYITSSKSNSNLKWLLYHNDRVYDRTKAEVLEVLGLTESDYQSKLIEKIRSEVDEFNNR